MEDNAEPEEDLSIVSGTPVAEEGHAAVSFSERVNTHDPAKIAELMIAELNYIGGCAIQLWHRMLEVTKQAPRQVMVYLSDIYTDNVKDIVNHCCFKEVVRNHEFVAQMEEQEGEIHRNIAM
jgi:hypothetical protein